MVNILMLTFFIFSSTTAQDDLTFPDDFIFGVATSSYQIEGAWNEDGKTINVWDRLTHETPELIIDGSSGDVACDSYHKWQDDIENLKTLGVTHYRFSLAWTRIIPQGYTNNINPAGVVYYNNLINGLLEAGIEPVVTLYHWDQPERLSYLGGLPNSAWKDYYVNYARTAFRLFGDRVKYWITFNEPYIICNYINSVFGTYYEEYPLGVIEYLCGKTLLLAHAETYHVYDREFRNTQHGQVGITLNFEWAEPATESPEDVEAAERKRQFNFGYFANPIFNLDFPQVVIDRIAERSILENYPKSRLVQLTLAEKLLIRGTADFLGLNYYTTWYVHDIPEPSLEQTSFKIDTKVDTSQNPDWETAGNNKVVPWGLRSGLDWIKRTYHDPRILITENGYSDRTRVLNDDRRISFIREHLNAVLEAIHLDGVTVIGYFYWSLMDNFEWNSGYTIKFGLFDVDFDDPNRPRTARDSVEYYKNVIATRTLS